MTCKEDYSIFSEDVTRELRMVRMDSKYSSEDGSDGERNEDEDNLAFEYLEAETSESSKVEAFVREKNRCQLGD